MYKTKFFYFYFRKNLRVVVEVGFQNMLDVGWMGDVGVGGERHGNDDGS